ncbi:SEC-C domain-containing protein [Actinoplanes sp. NPDC051513]|uniref:SEC-C domain-containing protein n=1 Tax=Actinoplanes sp. NPDC051513 TaxID=3363908 RepID=UPI0037BCFB42
MSLKADLTSADLTEIRQSALGAADPLGLAADLAEAADAGRLADKDDAGYALALAAEIAESRSKLDAALRYAERAVDAYGTRDDPQAGAARALRARILFRTGRGDEAMADLESVRPLLTQHPDAAAYVSAALAAGGRNRVAEQWLTDAVQAVLADRDQPAEPASAEDAGLLFFLLQQRHRTRHALGLQHDHHDNLADRLETRLANAAARPSEEPVFFPQAEFGKLLAQWPALSGAYGADWDEHRAHLERELVRQAGAGSVGLSLLPADVAGLTRFAGAGGDPAAEQTRTGYARQLASGTARIPWPPERNEACWCGSGLKYKKCCLPRSRG